MTAPAEVSLVTLGGKGASLSPASVFAVANGSAKVRIDSSASNQKNKPPPSPTAKFRFSLLKDLTLEEARASLLLALNKLLVSSSGGLGIRPFLLDLITNALNSPQTLSFLDDEIDVTDDELLFLDKSLLYIVGAIAGILDHQAPALSAVADAVAALSCEASGANVAAFNLIDSGDGSSVNKGEVGVASDLKVFLNGSKLVGKLEADSVSEIPQVHGALREISRLMHSMTRAELNSPIPKGGKGSGTALAGAFLSFAATIRKLGENSLSRAKLNIDALSNADFNSSLMELLDSECPKVNVLGELFIALSQAELNKEYVKFFHDLNSLFDTVRKIVSWEALTAFVSLEGVDAIDKTQDSGESAKPEKKKNKKKALGKGSNLLVQFIKDKLQSGVGDIADSSVLLERWRPALLQLLDPKNPSFPDLLSKVKEIVESNESRRLPKLPKGTRDFSREQMAIREKAFSIITDVFKRHGGTALDTPAFELRETLMGKYGEDSKLIYDLADQGGELCSLRYDLTVPFARFVAMNGITSLKRYQIAKVYRRDNPSKGRYREFYQCDFDIAGQCESMGPDFEVVKVMTELLDELRIGDYEIKLNHRKLLDGMLEICGVPAEKFRTICSSIDKLDKQSFEQIKKEMVEEKGLTVETADTIGTFVKERGSPLELLSKLKEEGSKFLGNKDSLTALNELEILFKALESSKCVNKVVFDLSLARGLDYYTGVIFEAVFKGATQVGSIAAGGRYDNLIGMFGTKQVPAVGVSLGIERVFTIMEQLQKDKNQVVRATETQVLVGVLGEDLSLAAGLVNELWAAKIKAEYIVNKRPMKHIERAKASKIPWLVLVGDREVKDEVVKLKDVEASKEETIPRNTLVQELQIRLSAAAAP